jgi:hypothetical protein
MTPYDGVGQANRMHCDRNAPPSDTRTRDSATLNLTSVVAMDIENACGKAQPHTPEHDTVRHGSVSWRRFWESVAARNLTNRKFTVWFASSRQPDR